jgi:hypothetical protein
MFTPRRRSSPGLNQTYQRTGRPIRPRPNHSAWLADPRFLTITVLPFLVVFSTMNWRASCRPLMVEPNRCDRVALARRQLIEGIVERVPDVVASAAVMPALTPDQLRRCALGSDDMPEPPETSAPLLSDGQRRWCWVLELAGRITPRVDSTNAGSCFISRNVASACPRRSMGVSAA